MITLGNLLTVVSLLLETSTVVVKCGWVVLVVVMLADIFVVLESSDSLLKVSENQKCCRRNLFSTRLLVIVPVGAITSCKFVAASFNTVFVSVGYTGHIYSIS